jgi:peptidoglycan biosynthesis protein MviN/MurJ (putative lipid II flippase)
MRWFGVAGIALATSLWSVSTLIFLWYWSRRLLSTAATLRPSGGLTLDGLNVATERRTNETS